MTESHNSPCELLHVLQGLRFAELDDGADLGWVRLDAALGNDEAE
jgi:hypothetical protein